MMKAIAASAMNRAKAISSSFRILNSSLATQNQVSRYSSFTPLPLSAPFHHLRFPSIHHKLHFSTKPNSIAELILTNDWSQDLEHELVKCSPSLTHETVIYVLKRIDKNPEKAYSFFNWVIEKEWFRASSSVFSLIVRVLANKQTMKQFWITLRKMKEKAFYLDEETYLTISIGFKKAKLDSDAVALKHFFEGMLRENAMESVVTKVVDIILGSEWDDKVESELTKVKIQLSDNFVIRVLKVLRSHPLKAYKFFNWVGKQSGYQQNTVTYNAVARVLARMDSIEEFWTIIDEMKNVGYELDIDTYIKISRQLQKTKMVEDAVRLYELMMDSSYKPSVQDCIFLLKSISASDKPNLDLVFRVANKFEATGRTLPKAMYDAIHGSLTSDGQFDEAEKIVMTMKSAGYEPDNITYSKLVFRLCKMRRFEEAYEVLEGMESRGCFPDSNTWSVLIQGHSASDEVDKALLYLGKMIKKGCNADAAAIGAVVDSLLSEKKIDDARKLLMEMVTDCGASPSQHTYEKLIERLLGIKKFEEALDLFCLARKAFNKPMLFVQYVSKFGTVEDAAKYLKAWRKGSPQSHSAYLHVFESFIEEGRVSDAKDLLCKCPPHIRNRKRIREFFASVEICMAGSKVLRPKI